MSSPPPDRISGHGLKRTRVFADDDEGRAADGALPPGPPPLDLVTAIPVHQRACVRCKNLKVKCEVKSINEIVADPCRRCRNAGYECLLPGTKKRKAPPKRGDLMTTIQEQASQIRRLHEQLQKVRALAPAGAEHLLPPLEPEPAVREWIVAAVPDDGADSDAGETEDDDWASSGASRSQSSATTKSSGDRLSPPGGRPRKVTPTIPSEASPFGLLASLSLEANAGTPSLKGGSEDAEEDGVGLNEPTYFEKGPAPDSLRGPASAVNQKLSPAIFTKKIITTKEAEQLFGLYYEYLNVTTFLLDRSLYGAQQTCLRSTFLFTVVCAVASRFVPGRPELYDPLMEHALIMAGMTLSNGAKSVEIVYAYLLLALYPRPQRRWEEDRRWWYLGVANRVAMDLGLHLCPPTLAPEEKRAREALARTRAWIVCWISDRLHGSFTGSGVAQLPVDAVAARGDSWYQSSPYNVSGDAVLSAMVPLMTCLYNHRAKIYTDVTQHMGFNKNQDFRVLGISADNEMSALQQSWVAHMRETLPATGVRNAFRLDFLRMFFIYARLRYLSFCIAHTSEEQHAEERELLQRCHRAALELIRCFLHDLCRPEHRIFVRHAPDALSLIVTIAASILIKLLKAPFMRFFTPAQLQEMRDVIQQTTDMLMSPELSVDEQHGPRMHARFLALLSAPPSEREPQTPQPGAMGMEAQFMTRSPGSGVPINAAFEPALMDLYNSAHGPPSWTFAAGSQAAYSPQPPMAVVAPVDAGVVGMTQPGWYTVPQEYYPPTYGVQDALHYPAASSTNGASGMQWTSHSAIASGYAVPSHGLHHAHASPAQQYSYPAQYASH